jgi:hypothetical protein
VSRGYASDHGTGRAGSRTLAARETAGIHGSGFAALAARHRPVRITGVAPVWRIPSINSLSACSRLSRPTSSTANEGRVIARARSVFGDLNLNPFFVCSRLSTMRTVPRSRSTFRQRSARTSPRRAPVASASRTGQKMCECRTASRSRADRSAVKVSRAAGSHRRALAGRVEDWRAGLGRCRATFPAPSTSNAACGFPALRSPICFMSRLMGPILLGRLSACRVALDSR